MLITLVEVSLVLVYLCVLLIKTCDMSSLGSKQDASAEGVSRELCATFGFGDTASGEKLGSSRVSLAFGAMDSTICLVSQAYTCSSFSLASP